jgi:hypothetical protein
MKEMEGTRISTENASKATRKLIAGMHLFLIKFYKNEYPPIPV